VQIVQVTDGTSNTVAVGERFRAITNPAYYPEQEYAASEPLTEYGTWAMGTNQAENHMECALGSTGIPFNYNGVANGYSRFPASNTAGCYSSLHPGGVQFVFLDGHVAFFPTATADLTRLAIGTIAGGETADISGE